MTTPPPVHSIQEHMGMPHDAHAPTVPAAPVVPAVPDAAAVQSDAEKGKETSGKTYG